MAEYKWGKTNVILRRMSDGAAIPWPPQESEGFNAKRWMDAGNVPDPEDSPVPPMDMSDPDNNEKAVKALVLCIAQVGSLTVPQAKALFKSKWQSLP